MENNFVSPSSRPSPAGGEGARVLGAISNNLNFFSKLAIVGETVVALVLATLFVMAIRRRFRR